MSTDPSTAALLAWCEQEATWAKGRRLQAENYPDAAAIYSDHAERFGALAAIVRAHETLEAEIEKLPVLKPAYGPEWVQKADVLRLLAARGAQR